MTVWSPGDLCWVSIPHCPGVVQATVTRPEPEYPGCWEVRLASGMLWVFTEATMLTTEEVAQWQLDSSQL